MFICVESEEQEPKTVGARILWARSVGGWTAAELAREIGKSSSYIRHLEKGLYKPGADAVFELCRVFGVKPVWLLRGLDPKPTEKSIVRALTALKVATPGTHQPTPDAQPEGDVA